jgi:hypothetical protein
MDSKRFKLGTHRGARRVWIQGTQLTAAGFARGRAYTVVTFPDGGMELSLTPDGERRVAGTDKRPIIDINSRLFADSVAYVLVTFGEGQLRISPESPQ